MRKTILLFFISILLINTASASVTFTNIRGDFTIEYPSGWSYVENNDGTEQTFTSKTGRASVMVVVVPSTGRTLKQIVDNRKIYLNELDLYPFDQKSVTINGVRGIEWTFIEYYAQEDDKNEQIVLLSDDNYFIITAWAQDTDYPFYSDDFDQIINSIQITAEVDTTTEHEVMVPASSFATYTDEERKFRIKYPSSWNTFDIYNDEAGYEGDSYTYIEDPDSNTGVYVSVFPADGMTLDQNVEGFIRSWNELDVYPYNERDITINKLKAHEWEFIYTNPDTYTVWKEKEVILLFDDKVYTIIGFSERGEYSQYSNLLDQIINSFEIVRPDTTKTTIPVGTATPVATVVTQHSTSFSLHGEKTDVELGEEIILTLSVVKEIHKPPMTVQVILIPPSGMSVTATGFSETAAGQYSNHYLLKEADARHIEVRMRGNQIGEFEVIGKTVYYFGDNKSTAKSDILTLPIKVRAVGGANGGGKQDDDDPSGVGGLIAILAIIFTGYVIFNKLKNKSTKSKKTTAEVKSQDMGVPNLQAPADVPADIQEEEPVKPKPPIEKKESSFEVEKRKQHNILPPENLDFDTKSYLSSGVNVAVSTLDAEITRAESDALQINGEIKEIEDIIGKLGTRFVNKDISEQTYNNLKNKYQRKVSELKSKVTNIESETAKKKEIRSFIQEKGTYYYT